MEKRVLLAVVLSFVVLYGYQAMFPPPKPQPKPPVSTGQGAAGTPAATPASPTGTTAEAPPPPGAPAPAALVADTEERDVTFDNDSVTAVFTTRGGVLKSWRLKKYQDAARGPLELVPHAVPAGSARPFTLTVQDAAVSATLAQALFKPSASDVRVTSAPATLTFEYQDASGLTARKEYSFAPGSPYVINGVLRSAAAWWRVPPRTTRRRSRFSIATGKSAALPPPKFLRTPRRTACSGLPEWTITIS
jgi:YidC/Oxa1 family membrane protein insertase